MRAFRRDVHGENVFALKYVVGGSALACQHLQRQGLDEPGRMGLGQQSVHRGGWRRQLTATDGKPGSFGDQFDDELVITGRLSQTLQQFVAVPRCGLWPAALLPLGGGPPTADLHPDRTDSVGGDADGGRFPTSLGVALP